LQTNKTLWLRDQVWQDLYHVSHYIAQSCLVLVLELASMPMLTQPADYHHARADVIKIAEKLAWLDVRDENSSTKRYR
jgi:predicted  nucleic acid-binding Zn ribbon protein